MAKAKPDAIDLRLKRVAELAAEPDAELLRGGLRSCFRDSSNLVIAKAAEIIGEQELTEFVDDLKSLWPTLLEEPLVRDKGCAAKTAIIDALARLGHDDPDLYLVGMKYVQVEPGWPSSSDTAVNVRGGCAQALARSWRIGVNDKLIAMTELLEDPERLVRVHAVNAIADVGHECVVPLLRVKAQCGDFAAEVTGACLSALLRLAPQGSLPFVSRFLRSSNEQLINEAAAALGESGLPEAINLLIKTYQHAESREFKESLLVSLGLSRQPSAVDFLISLMFPVTYFTEPALKALAPIRFYPEIHNRVLAGVEATQNRRLRVIFNDLFKVS